MQTSAIYRFIGPGIDWQAPGRLERAGETYVLRVAGDDLQLQTIARRIKGHQDVSAQVELAGAVVAVMPLASARVVTARSRLALELQAVVG